MLWQEAVLTTAQMSLVVCSGEVETHSRASEAAGASDQASKPHPGESVLTGEAMMPVVT